MKLSFSSLLLILVLLSSCQEDPKVRALQQEKETQKREVIFSNINKGWNFNSQPLNQTSRELTTNWAEWRVFLNELGQKPKSSIGAFQQKAKTLSKRAAELNINIPIKYSIPEVKSRIAVLTTKVNAINLYIHLNQIPDQKIVQLVQEINTEVASMQWQLDEIKRKSEIKTEDGEGDMLRMLDTARAVPTNPVPKIIK
ncbi:hypothetical protein [Flavobacterium sangjuense]|uniref:Lipoprotein n=1 Tax=Flavobacterium sangjuense TaxID=2518177 RepID=A0A4P7PRK8_9FLAO|nr:hypothetical protein [Flavobacterium sangjuense]QBZ97236.1 hypothetical protein GS03_00722 [Flavobacterium sangjuense]